MISLSFSVIQIGPRLCQRHETEKETERFSSRKHGGELKKNPKKRKKTKKRVRAKSRLFLVFLQVVFSVLLAWFNTCGSTTLHTGLFSGSESSTTQ